MKFATGSVGSKIRNVLIASTLFKCGYIDAFGTGFDRTFTLCIDDNIKYHYTNDDFGFTFIFDRNVNFLNDKINDKINDKMNETDRKIVDTIKFNKYITISELVKEVNKSEPTVYRHIESLMKDNILSRVGSRKNGYWKTKL